MGDQMGFLAKCFIVLVATVGIPNSDTMHAAEAAHLSGENFMDLLASSADISPPPAYFSGQKEDTKEKCLERVRLCQQACARVWTEGIE